MLLDDPTFAAWCRRHRVWWVSLHGYLDRDTDGLPWDCEMSADDQSWFGEGSTAEAAVRAAVEDARLRGIDPPEGWGDVPSA